MLDKKDLLYVFFQLYTVFFSNTDIACFQIVLENLMYFFRMNVRTGRNWAIENIIGNLSTEKYKNNQLITRKQRVNVQ